MVFLVLVLVLVLVMVMVMVTMTLVMMVIMLTTYSNSRSSLTQPDIEPTIYNTAGGRPTHLAIRPGVFIRVATRVEHDNVTSTPINGCVCSTPTGSGGDNSLK